MRLAALFLFPLIAFGSPDFEREYKQLASDAALSDSVRLGKLFDLDWRHGLAESPEFATYVGIPGSDDRWTDMSRAAIARRNAEQQWPLEVLKTIDPAKLSAPERLNYELFRKGVEEGIEGDRFPFELLAISQLGGVQQDIPQTLNAMPASNVKAYENILGRMRSAPTLIDQNIALLQRGLEKAITPPAITLRDVPAQVLDVIPDNPEKSAILQPFENFPDSISEDEQKRLKGEAVSIYKDLLVPSFGKLHQFLVEKYLPGARTSIGFDALPDGKAWYDYCVRTRTTTNLSPKEIHEIGLKEVARIRGRMDALIAELQFQGDFDAFTEFLRTDKQFFYESGGKLLAGYRDIAKRIDPELPHLFGKLPRLTYGVKAVPAYSEKSAPTAYYEGGSMKAGRPGWFYANTYDLSSRPKWQMECLTLHEAVPGHHLQISLAQEMDGVPEFRKYGGYTAYVEGWGLYAESLGSELGLYEDPYSKFGALTYEMWRAVRLVVDTGIHAFGWTRDEAIDYMQKNTGKSRHDATVEIDRYMIWPGQALAYKLGELKIRELREQAEKKLGDRFDIRAFHDELLANGALPLDVLQSTMQEWINSQKAD